jgi:hypothetical protein
MEGTAAAGSGKTSQVLVEDAKTAQLKERLEKLLQEAAEVEVQLSRADGTIHGVPHYSIIEGRAHVLGQQLSREVQQRQVRELAACQPPTAKCPQCGARCDLRTFGREVNSVDVHELVGDCPCCRRSFFPAAGDFGI